MRRAVLLLLGALLAAAPSQAQRGRRGSAELARHVEQLGADDPAAVRGALESLGILGDARAAQPIAERIRRGLPPDLLEPAISTLALLGSPEAGPVLFELASHRRPEVRLAAVQAITAVRPRGADRALAQALGDADPQVRAAAASGLGELGATSALDSLFLALDRHVPEAAAAIGRLARPAEVERFLGYLGRLPFDLVTLALGEMLSRDSLAEPARLSIVHRLAELATPEARAFLEQLLPSLPERSRVRRAAEDAVGRIGP
ncbi:MAG TPA: HEAT repeat domain-containing protein [Sandaracinaceae bacterium]